MFAKLGQSEFFSKIDLQAAYHQVPIQQHPIEHTAFICEFGLFGYISMPLGISSASSWFQRLIDLNLRDCVSRDSLNVYIDDIILFTKNLDTHE